MTACHVHSPGLRMEQGDGPEGKEASLLLPLNKKSRKHHNEGGAGRKTLMARQGEEAWFLQHLPSRAQGTCSGAAGKKLGFPPYTGVREGSSANAVWETRVSSAYKCKEMPVSDISPAPTRSCGVAQSAMTHLQSKSARCHF